MATSLICATYQLCSQTSFFFFFVFPHLQNISFLGGPEPSDSSPVISHGRIIEGKKSVYSIGDSVTIECYAGYTLHGAARIEYIGEGRWSPEVPICKLSKYKLQAFPIE